MASTCAPSSSPVPLAGGLHRGPGRQERRQPEADPAEPPREDLDHGVGAGPRWSTGRTAHRLTQLPVLSRRPHT